MINLILIIAITLYSGYIIYTIIRNYVKSLKEGTTLSCYSCPSHKNGSCTSNSCTSEEKVNEMIAQAKKNLAKKEEKK